MRPMCCELFKEISYMVSINILYFHFSSYYSDYNSVTTTYMILRSLFSFCYIMPNIELTDSVYGKLSLVYQNEK